MNKVTLWWDDQFKLIFAADISYIICVHITPRRELSSPCMTIQADVVMLRCNLTSKMKQPHPKWCHRASNQVMSEVSFADATQLRYTWVVLHVWRNCLLNIVTCNVVTDRRVAHQARLVRVRPLLAINGAQKAQSSSQIMALLRGP